METINIDQLTEYDRNPRQIADDQFQALCDNLIKYGFLDPLVVDQENVVLGGNQRLRAAKHLLSSGYKQFEEVPVFRVQAKDDSERARMSLILNNHHGEWDTTALAEMISDFYFDLGELPDLGFDDSMLKSLTELTKIEMINSSDENAEWVGMPEFEPKGKPFQLIISFETEKDREDFEKKYKIKILNKQSQTWSTWFPYKEREDLASLRFENE